ncbi:MAG: glycosyltransferase family 2 protein [Candidatus Eisenbacteria sp.]|nr:glycosyltransferase family 2 protein [Candidatus Eisenbacteria bacterium]
MRIFLLGCIAFLAYVYVGYPLICSLLAGVSRRRIRTGPITPKVSILIAAYNEAIHISATVRNKLELDYPADHIEIIVISDGSDDGTDEVVAEIAASEDRVKLIRQEPRAGKTSALNAGAALAGGNIFVFSDANSLYAPDALRKLLEPFGDPDVGYVTGQMLYKSPDGSLTGKVCSIYMRYENALRVLESAIGSVVGVAGGIDAIRAELYTAMRPDQQPDFVLPLSVVERGWRVVYVPGARLFETSLAETSSEFRMRSRVTLRAWHALRDKAGLLNPFRYGLYSWQLFSHKWLRYLAHVFQVGALVSNAALLGHGPMWDGLFVLQAIFYLVAALGFLGRSLPAPLSFPYYLCLLNAAAGWALVRFLLGHKQVTWTPRT